MNLFNKKSFFKKIFFCSFFALLLVSQGYVIPQTKVGYIDSKKIVDNMQEAKDAKSKLDNLILDWQKELTTLQDSVKKMKDDFDKKKLILTEQLKQQREKEITDLDLFISEFKTKKFGDGGEYIQKQTEFMKPVYDRIFNAIQIVANEGDYDYVFDRTSDLMLLFVNEKYDLTAKVMRVVEGK